MSHEDDRNGDSGEADAGSSGDGGGDGDGLEGLPDSDVDNPFEHLPDGEPDEDPFERIEADPAAGIDEDAGGAGEAIVPKDRYCERCEHFSGPPEVRCTHAGTEIRELVDMDHFRVYDCPVVAERREIRTVVATDPDAVVEEDRAGSED